MAPLPALPPPTAIRRELYFFTLYRLLEAALLCLAAFSPVGQLLGELRHPALARWIAGAYLLAALVLFARGRGGKVGMQAGIGIAVDIVVAALAMYAIPDLAAGIAMMLLFNVGAASLLMPPRTGLAFAAVAAVALVVEAVLAGQDRGDAWQQLPVTLMFGVGCVAIATLTSLLGRQLRSSEALAEERGTQVANLAEVNELIIRRMRTGVVLVGEDGEIKLANEAAMLHLGDAGHGRRTLALAAPALAQRLREWQANGESEPVPLQLEPDLPEVLPRFTRLLADSDQVLVFLDDAELASRRAETLTLATLGRFSASLAHEIRNPLAAISYATQLLEESRDIGEADRRLLQIIYQQAQRMNGIVENVLGLARRERAQPQHVELGAFAREFVADYAGSHPLEQATLEAKVPNLPVLAMVDRRQLQQVVTVLVHNALVYGRLAGEPARVALHVHLDDRGAPLLDVVDRGPGIPEAVATRLFSPFFSTSSHGTGLGLYIARELCLANQAHLSFVPLPAGGACFRIRLAGVRAIETPQRATPAPGRRRPAA